MHDHDIAPPRTSPTATTTDADAHPRRGMLLGLSIGGGVLSLAVLQQPAVAGLCGGVVVESPGNTAAIDPANGAVDCVVIGDGDALLSESGRVTPLVSFGAPTGTTTYTYDAVGRVPTETDSLGTTTMAYDSAGRVTASTDPLSHVTTYTYDAVGLTDVIEPGNRVVTYQYDGQSRLTSVTEPGGSTYTYQYDPGQVIQTAPGNLVTTYTYDSVGSLSTIDALGKVTTYTYDTGGSLSTVVDVLNNTTTYSYDVQDRLTSLVDPMGNTTTFAYDALSRVSVDTGDSDGATTFAYASAVPEPSTLALLLSGLAGWARLRRRSRSRDNGVRRPPAFTTPRTTPS